MQLCVGTRLGFCVFVVAIGDGRMAEVYRANCELLFVEDLGSKKGTFVDGDREPVRVQSSRRVPSALNQKPFAEP
jgi:hypothetical protein